MLVAIQFMCQGSDWGMQTLIGTLTFGSSLKQLGCGVETMSKTISGLL